MSRINEIMKLKNWIKNTVKCNGTLYFGLRAGYIWFLKKKSSFQTKFKIETHLVKIDYDIIGQKNIIEVGSDTIIEKLKIHIRGNNNILKIGKSCYIGKDCLIYIEGNNCNINIGDLTTSTRNNEFNAQEDNSRITIGKDCMLSNNITIRTSDSHPIFDMISGNRLNNASNTYIGNHVWIAPNSKIMKGAYINNGAIIGSDTTVNKEIPMNCIVVGRPAKIVRNNVKWTRDELF